MRRGDPGRELREVGPDAVDPQAQLVPSRVEWIDPATILGFALPARRDLLGGCIGAGLGTRAGGLDGATKTGDLEQELVDLALHRFAARKQRALDVRP